MSKNIIPFASVDYVLVGTSNDTDTSRVRVIIAGSKNEWQTSLMLEPNQNLSSHTQILRTWTTVIQHFLRTGNGTPSFLFPDTSEKQHFKCWQELRGLIEVWCTKQNQTLAEVILSASGWDGQNKLVVYVTNLTIPKHHNTAFVSVTFLR